MASLGQLVVNLEANIARFTSDMGRASQATEQAMSKIDGAVEFGKKALGALGVALSVDLLVSEVNRSLDALAALDDMAQKTGSSVEMLSKLSKVADFTGTELGAVDGMLVKLSKNLNDVDEKGNKTAKALAAIGISTDDIKNKDPAEVFVQVANKLQDYEDGAGKVALVTDLMGKSAADMLPFMNDVAESLDKFQGDSKEAAAQAAALQDQMGLLRVKYGELRTEIVVAALPAANAFLGALIDTKTKANDLTKNTSVDTWADDVAIGLARVADRAKLTVGMLGALSGSVKVVAADVLTSLSVTPTNIAKQIGQGKNPLDEFRAMLAGREKILEDANAKWDQLLNAPVNAIEEGTRKRIAEQKEEAGRTRLAASLGINSISSGKTVDYRSGSDSNSSNSNSNSNSNSDKEGGKDKGWSREAAAARMIQFAFDESAAIENTAAVTENLIKSDARRADQYARSAAQITANAQQIRMSLMTDAQAEQFEHDTRLAELHAYGELRLTSEEDVNALIEAETARHERAKADLQRATQLQSLGVMGDTADQMYNLLKQSGEKQNALAKAAFLASKAIAVAEIIIQTNLAASKAEGQLGIFGLPQSAIILAAGYSRAAMVAGTAIASAEGGYDIPAGVNPVTQLHEKEMVLPKAQAEVIRGLAGRGGAGGGGVTIHSAPVINIDSRTDQQEVRKIVAMGVAQGNADLVDKLQRAGRI